MAPSTSTSVSIRLTEPVVYLVGGVELERARARRRAIATPFRTPAGSRPPSRAPSPPPGISSIVEGGDHFINPSPARGLAARARSPTGLGGSSRSASRSRITAGTTTGSGTREENERADEPPQAILRGLLTLTLVKPSRIRDITVKFKGTAKTDWPEGIGPRRLDVLETNQLCSESWTFFSASDLTDERRAVSIGPGVAEQRELDHRGRSGSRRSASMIPTMPSRAPSAGAAYSSNRDSRSYEQPIQEMPATIDEQEERSTETRQYLPRIPSLDTLNRVPYSPPPVHPAEPSPAYELAPSSHTSPIASTSQDRFDSTHSPTRSAHSSRPHFLQLATNQHITHPRSPLGPNSPSDVVSPVEGSSQPSTPYSDRVSLFRVESSSDDFFGSSNGSVLSSSEGSHDHLASKSPIHSPIEIDTHLHTSFPAASPLSSPVTPNLALSSVSPNMHPALSLQRSRDLLDRPSLNRSSSSALSSSTDQPCSTSSSRPHSVIPTRRAPSTAPPPAARSASLRPSGRFSLGALGDVLRGKSTSRVRDSSQPSKIRGARDRTESPDGRGSSDRNESRGRKTALKVLRDRLTAGLDGSVVSMTIDSDDEGDIGGEKGDDDVARGREISKGWKEFRAGTYTYPISIPIPASLPPSIKAEFGTVLYTLKATVHRAGALTTNLTASSEIICVSCPGQDDTEENESIVVERAWENQLIYHIALSSKTFPIGGSIPIYIRLNPMAKIKFFRLTVVLEQKVSYFGANRKVTRHEAAKKFQLLRVDNKDNKEPLLPILSDSPDAIKDHPLAGFFINPTSSDDTTPSLLDPLGPWLLESSLKLPECSSGIKFSTAHDKANITVTHLLKVMLRVQRGDDDFLDTKGNRKLWDVIIETPVHILSCRCTQTNLPAYSAPFSTLTSAAQSRETTCCHDRASSPPPPARTSSRSRSSHSPAPIVTNLQENLLFARLVAGEITSSGEEPPSYVAVRSGAVIERRTSSSSVMTARGRTSIRGGGGAGGSQVGSSPISAGGSLPRGRSDSVDTIAMSTRAR